MAGQIAIIECVPLGTPPLLHHIEAGALFEVLIGLYKTVAVQIGTEVSVTENQCHGKSAVKVCQQFQ